VTVPRLFLLCLVATLPIGASAGTAAACSGGPYVYAGVAGQLRVSGVGATITPTSSAFDVRAGHVAGWVGVGGPGEGPNGSDEWIQVGFSAFPDWLGSDLYYEVARPGSAPAYSRVRSSVEPGKPVRVSVAEVRGRRDWWRVWVGGRPASKPIHLPQSDHRWRPVATAESWDAGVDVCNAFAYRFDGLRVALAPGGLWQPLAATTPITSSHTVLVRHTGASFVAAAGPLARGLLSR
jgi:hypothetical protein